MLTSIEQNITFLIYCCKVNNSKDEESYIEEYIKNLEDIESIIKLSTKHAIFPLVAKHLSGKFKSIKSYMLKHTQHNMSLSIELINIVKFLEEKGIKTLSFKGATLAQSAYGSITQRQFADIDILIEKDDRFKMYKCMIEANYIPEIEATKSFLNSVNVLGFYHPTSKVYIEIHWELLAKNYAIRWEESHIWQTLSSVTINHTHIPTMSLEQELLYLCIHGGKHLYERLSWVCDIDRTLRVDRAIDWGIILSEANSMRVKRILLTGLYLSHKLLSTPLPLEIKEQIDADKMVKSMAKDIVALQFNSKSVKYIGIKKFIILYKIREHIANRTNFIYRAMFTPKFDDFKSVKLPDYLWFLYPIIRPVRLLLKYFK